MSNSGSNIIDSSRDSSNATISDALSGTSSEALKSSSIDNANSESLNQKQDFGKILSQARIDQDYSIAEVNEQIKISQHVLLALEASDIAALPAPTFTQGYIHSYAKFLEISEEKVLDLYRHAINGNSLSSLKPRSTLSKKSSSQFPFVKIVMALLVIISVLVLIYNGLQSDDAADLVDGEPGLAEDRSTDDAVDTDNVQKIEIKQQARLNEEGELLLDKNNLNNQQARVVSNGVVSNNGTVDKATATATETEGEADADVGKASAINVSDAAVETDVSGIVVTEVDGSTVDNGTAESSETTTAIESAENITQSEQLEIDLSDIVPDTEIIDPGNDTISFFAELEAWVDVRDANDTQLYYNMLPEGGSRVFTGLAPFSVTIGNARTIIVEINNIEVNLSRRIRSTNTATFTISTNEKRVVFH